MSAANHHPVGFQLSFRDVKYEVKSRTEKGSMLTLLENVSGYFSPGQLSALMGPSGSGKTTLLDVLAGRKTQGKISGDIRFAGHPPTTNLIRRYAGYVEQFDTLIDVFTVREMLLYTAELKRPAMEPFESKKAAVDALITKLGLDECQNTKIGSSLDRGISGGQAKRVNIGIALVSQPRVLFLDEPTSGLDSYTSNEVMTVVKNLARDGKTVCTTIHAPTPYTHSLFDTLMILIRGETVYFGSRENAIGYFEALTKNIKSDFENSEAEWITDVTVQAAKNRTDRDMALAYEASDMRKRAIEEVDIAQKGNSAIDANEYKQLSQARATVTSAWHAIKIFLKFLVPRLASRAVIVFILSTLFEGVGDDFSVDNFGNIGGLLFIWSAMPVFSAVAYLPSLILERSVFYRETSDGLYRPIAYITGKIFDEIVLAIVSSIPFAAIVYAATKLQGSLALFCAAYCGNLLVGVAIAYAIAAAAPSLDVAGAMLPAYASTMLLTAGFMIRRNDIPAYYDWYTYINFVQYAFSALLKNQYDTDKAENLLLRVRNGEGGFRDVPMLEYYSIEDVNPAVNVIIVYVFFIAFSLLAFVAMQFIRHEKR